MAGGTTDVLVRFLSDTTQLKSGLKEVESSGQRLQSYGKGIAASLGGVALGAAIRSTITAASDLNETVAASEAVFGRSAKSIQSWAGQASSDFGQSKQQALEAATGFGNMFDQLGIGTPKAAKMSQTMVELASDFASFKNVDVTEVLEAQSSAFRGEYDAMQKFVPTLTAATVETKALAMTGKENAAQLTAQDKAAATYALMIDKAGKAMGDYDRTADGAANKQRQFAAQMADAQATIGQALLPAFSAVLGVLSQVAAAFASLPAPVQTALAALTVFGAGVTLLWSSGVKVVEAVKGIGSAVGHLGDAIGPLGPKLGNLSAGLAQLTPAMIGAAAGFSALFVAAGAFAYWSATTSTSWEDAAEAGRKWGQVQVENTKAMGDSTTQLQALAPALSVIQARLNTATEARRYYAEIANLSSESENRSGISMAEAGSRAPRTHRRN